MIVVFGSKLTNKLGLPFNIDFIEDQSNMAAEGAKEDTLFNKSL